MKGVLVCKACLITNVKMFYLDSLVAYAYSELTGLQCDDESTEYVCYECAALLLKYQQFRTKCLKANLVKAQYVEKLCELTEYHINVIDRKLLNLESTINKYEIKENIFYEIYNESKFDNNDIKVSEQSVKVKVDDVIEASETEDVGKLYIDNDQAASNDNEPLYLEYLEDDFDVVNVVIVTSEVKDEVELYDNKDEAVSEENESSHSEDDISLDETPIKDVNEGTDDKSTKVKRKSRQPDNNILVQESDGKGKNSITKLPDEPSIGNGKKSNSFLEEYITVVKLTPEEAKKELLLRKESNNYKICLYKCDLCYRGFGTLHTYENHMKKHNKENGKYECEYCHARFSKMYYLSHHRVTYHTKKYYCKLCPQISSTIVKAKIHLGKHTGKKYQCEECGHIFSNPSSVANHKKFKHPSEFVCALCGNTCTNERGLNLHIKIVHKQETNEQKGPPCEECNVHFATETAWKRHLVLSSKHTVSNGCDVCGEIYESEEALRRHARVHLDQYSKMSNKSISCTLCEMTLVGRVEFYEHMKNAHPKEAPKIEHHGNTRREPYVCEVCGKVFKGDKRAEYFAHMKKDHPTVATKKEHRKNTKKEQYVCEVCGKMFKVRAFLGYHQRVHTGEKPYSCSECGKSFTLRHFLQNHIAIHSSVRAYKCHICQKAFVSRGSLDRHVKHHLGIRPYKCNICERAFVHPCEVKYHIKHTHYKVPWPKPKRNPSKRKKNAHD